MSYKKVDSDNCDLYNFPLPKLSEAELQKRNASHVKAAKIDIEWRCAAAMRDARAAAHPGGWARRPAAAAPPSRRGADPRARAPPGSGSMRTSSRRSPRAS